MMPQQIRMAQHANSIIRRDRRFYILIIYVYAISPTSEINPIRDSGGVWETSVRARVGYVIGGLRCRPTRTPRCGGPAGEIDRRLERSPSSGVDQKPGSAEVLRSGVGVDLRVQPRGGAAVVRAGGETRPEDGYGAVGNRACRRSQLQRASDRSRASGGGPSRS